MFSRAIYRCIWIITGCTFLAWPVSSSPPPTDHVLSNNVTSTFPDHLLLITDGDENHNNDTLSQRRNPVRCLQTCTYHTLSQAESIPRYRVIQKRDIKVTQSRHCSRSRLFQVRVT